MPTPLERMFTRALRGKGAGLGNAAPGSGYTGQGLNAGSTNPGRGRSNRRNPVAGTRSITYNSPGQPQPLDIAADELGHDSYLGSVYVMRCIRLIAETLAASPFVAGPDPFLPGQYDTDAPLARLLGPATPQAPGGPNPHLNSRAMWIWTAIQYITSGRWGWELQWDGAPGRSNIIGLWPLISIALAPIPIDGKEEIWAGFQYQTPTGQVQMSPDRVMYAWRPSIRDWRMPESVLQSAALPIFMHRAIDRYMTSLLKNNMVATTMVISPPFDEADQRRAWEDQFLSEFTGVDRAGGTIFGYAEADEDDPAGKPLVQVERLATTPVEASLQELSKTAKDDICIAIGTPRSLLGDASQRIYANSGAEYRNFWTITMLNIIAELEDHVNLRLAPRIEPTEVGWFDLSKVEALQPPSIFMPPDVAEAINIGILDAQQAASLLGIPPVGATSDSDINTVMVGEEATSAGAVGTGASRSFDAIQMRLRTWGFRGDFDPQTWVQVKPTIPMNRQTYLNPSLRVQPRLADRPRIRAAAVPVTNRRAEQLMEANAGLRALAAARTKSTEVKRKLAKHYPPSVLKWVDDAEWSGPERVDLDDIAMERRPGGRDQAKVDGIAKAIVADPSGPAAAPVVLVKTPGDDRLKVADGYHRTLAHRRLGHKGVPAYIGEVDSDEGPWDKAMHDAKLNRALPAAALSIRDAATLTPGGVVQDRWYGYAGSDSPEALPVVEVAEILTAPRPYVVEPYDATNGVPNHVVEAIAEALNAGGPNEPAGAR